MYVSTNLVKGVRISWSKYHRRLPIDDVHDHGPHGVDEKVVAMYPGHSAGRHLQQEGALLRNKAKHLGQQA